MMEPAQDRSHDNPRVPREPMASDRGNWYPGTRLRESRAEPRVRAAAIVVSLPRAKNPSQVLLPERNQGIETLSE